MHLATHQVIRVLKVGARAAIRIVAVLSAFLLASSDNLTWDAAAHIVASASHYAVAFALIGAVLDLISLADRTLWRYVSVSDAGAILRNSIVSVVLLLVAAFFLGRAVEMPRDPRGGDDALRGFIHTHVDQIGRARLHAALLLAERD